MSDNDNTDLQHYGTPRHSGRYPWGSGDDPEQRNTSFLGRVKALEDQGLSEIEVAKGMGFDKTSELRKKKTIAIAMQRAADAGMALRLKEKGMSNVAIGQRMGKNESTIRSLLNPALKERADVLANTANVVRDAVDKEGPRDIGAGVETHLGISRTKLNTAISMLEDEGYKVYYIKERQLGTGKNTSIKVLAPPGMGYAEVYRNRAKIRPVSSYSRDGGETFHDTEDEPVVSVDSKRIHIRYDEDGGSDKDGVIELRRGVEDLSLGDHQHYAQVRIGVDGSHYMKGMAMYSDNIPEGYDIIYNTNKAKGTAFDKVFKPMEKNPETGEIDQSNPFGALTKPKKYIGSDGKEHLSPLNIVNEEGKWNEWSRSLSSQVLSKQTSALAKKQLGLAFDLKKEEFDEIMSLTNPGVKKRLLETFADDCDAAAVHLKAAALPRQYSHIILPFNSIKENEIYAPRYLDGENVVLIRHPHGGTFEIPELIVNNKNRDARIAIGDAKDAVGINPKVAARLSGADFDGDTVIVIPNRDGNIRTSAPLKGLANFEPKKAYPYYDGMDVMDDHAKQLKMGEVSNLITDMTIKGANEDELARAVRHSMVVIDAVKHRLDHKRSYIENDIAGLKLKYQGKESGGAATLISRAKSEKHVPYRTEGKFVVDPLTGKKKRMYIDPETGNKLYEVNPEETYTRMVPDKRGRKEIDPVTGNVRYLDRIPKVVKRTTATTKMADEQDARNLISDNGGTKIERVYADHANSLKDLARTARKASLGIEPIPYSPTARRTYNAEVESLRAKLDLAYRNKPLERQAQLLANSMVSAKRKANPGMDKDHLKKIKGKSLELARARTGAGKKKIEITDKEWEAIQAGAVSNNVLREILLNTDTDSVKQRAMPRRSTSMSPARIARAKNMQATGYTTAEIADALGVSTSTLSRNLE